MDIQLLWSGGGGGGGGGGSSQAGDWVGSEFS